MLYFEILKKLRTDNKLLQKDIAKICNISTSAYQLWETGKTQPDINNLQLIADFYKVSVDFLIGRELEDGRVIIQEPELPNDENNLLANYRKLPSDLKESAQEYLKSLNNINNKHNIK